MSRIKIPLREQTPEASQPVLDKVEKMLGFVPNLQRLMSISPAALTGWAGLMGQLSTTLDVKTRDGIALAVSEADGCNYCLAAHSYIAHNLAKIDADGTVGHVEYSTALDGKPISIIDYPIADTVTDTMITATTWKSVWTKNGKVVERELETISADGKTFHEIDQGRDEKGKKFRNRLVFERP